MRTAQPAFPTRRLGSTELNISTLGFGGAGLGELFERVPENIAQATLTAAWGAGIRHFDTAPWYGHGLSEHRIGHFLRQQEPGSFTVSTKVGRIYRAKSRSSTFDGAPWVGGLPFELRFDYTHDGIMRSFEDSLQRLGLNRVDLVNIHDLDSLYHGTSVDAKLDQLDQGGGFDALIELKRDGMIAAIGAGVNELGVIRQFAPRFTLDAFLVAMPYTLLDQRAIEEELPLCVESGIGVVVGAPFASGVLATGVGSNAKYAYADVPPEIVTRVRRIEEVCARHGVSLKAAALQFPLGHSSVASVIPGAVSPEQVIENASAVAADIPAEFWADLKANELIHPLAPTPSWPES